jgi:c(7)-type cytochrome triheme protein
VRVRRPSGGPGRGRLGLVGGLGVLGLCVALVRAAPVIGAAFPSALRVPRTAAGPAPGVLPAALFSHRTHGTFGCFACHPSTFPQAPLGFTHADMNAGRFCGHCHDGGIAFAVAGTACGACHATGR